MRHRGGTTGDNTGGRNKGKEAEAIQVDETQRGGQLATIQEGGIKEKRRRLYK